MNRKHIDTIIDRMKHSISMENWRNKNSRSKVKGIKHDGVGFSIFLSKSAGLIKSSSVLFVWLTAKDFSSVAGPLTGTEDS